MVSAHRSADGGGGPDSVVHHHQYGGPLLLTAAVDASTLAEDPNKKIRKPYTITKSRESWTEQEHDKFLEALQLFDRDWKKIEAFVGSKTVIQIRSHAQKYFLKVQKNGTSEHVPPPRPKRKAAHPYPQKASKNTLPLSQSTVPFQSSSCLHEPGYALRTETSSGLRNSASSGQVSSWARGTIQPVSASQMTKEDVGPAGVSLVNNCCSSSSTESHSRICLTGEATDQGNDIPSLHVMPDFAQVYSFIGSIFDPGTSGHLEKLREMDPIDVETVLLLMRNLSVNLTSPDFEDHRFEGKGGATTTTREMEEREGAQAMTGGLAHKRRSSRCPSPTQVLFVKERDLCRFHQVWIPSSLASTRDIKMLWITL